MLITEIDNLMYALKMLKKFSASRFQRNEHNYYIHIVWCVSGS